MDYLRYLFDEELNGEGEVVISGYSFNRDKILRDLDRTAYDEAFIEWVEQRKKEKSIQADGILALYDNEGRFMKLKEVYSRGSVIPFIGAGLSIPSGYPGWTGFLKMVAAETELSMEYLEGLINSGLYEEAAEALCNELPAGAFLEQIENYFSVEKDIAGSVQWLPGFFSSVCITTNFDSVLERVFREQGSIFEHVLLGTDAFNLTKFLGEGRRVLVKLHGQAHTSKNRVLTKSEYDSSYSDGGSITSVLEVISNKTLLFIGCSLTFDRTLQILKSIAEKKGIENIPKHYAFLKLDDPEKRIERRNQLAECNIYPVWYTGDHDESLEALLEKLAEGK